MVPGEMARYLRTRIVVSSPVTHNNVIVTSIASWPWNNGVS